MRATGIVRALVVGVCMGAGALAVAPSPASADVAVCQFLQYGATLGCARVPAPPPPAPVAVGVGNELVPAGPNDPQVTQTYVCLYGSAAPTCADQTLGVPVIVSVAAGWI